MREPLNCRELLGHEDFPKLGLAVTEQQFLNLAAPVNCYFVRLDGKHLESQTASGDSDGIGLQPGLDTLGQPAGPAQQYHSTPRGRIRPGRPRALRQSNPPSGGAKSGLYPALYLGLPGHAEAPGPTAGKVSLGVPFLVAQAYYPMLKSPGSVTPTEELGAGLPYLPRGA